MQLKILLVIVTTCLATTLFAQQINTNLGPLEIFVAGPMEQEHLAIWIPADKTGPEINRSCRTRRGYQFSCSLTGHVEHRKTVSCPETLARLTAEFTAPLHQERLPLTLFNGWQWEYRYGLSQYEATTYDLPSDGSWENCLEAVAHQTNGHFSGQWMQFDLDGKIMKNSTEELSSDVNITTYSEIRTRHGYPKTRQLEE